jgi:hypothetical protein
MFRLGHLACVLLTPFIVGCGSRPAAGLYNNSDRIIIATVEQAGTPIVHRSLLRPGVWKVNSPVPMRLETVTVSWKEGDGQEFERAATVQDVPNAFDGTVWFKIESDRSVNVFPVTKEQENKGTGGPALWKRESEAGK